MSHQADSAPAAQESQEKKSPSVAFSVLTISVIAVFVGVCVGPLKMNVGLLLFLSWLLFAPFGAKLGYSFSELLEKAYEMGKNALPASAIILAVGVMMGTWLAAGTIATVLTVGLRFINPSVFLLVTMLLCSCVSLIMGSSWGTVGTAGIAMFGVGIGLGFEPALVVGAIVSGAYFGDKMSPMSDSTLMASTLSGTPLMTHIKYMALTCGPAFVLSGIIYVVLGFQHGGSNYDPAVVTEIVESLREIFKLGLIPIIPVVVVIYMLNRKKDTVLTLLTGALLGAVIAVAYQGVSIADIGAFAYKGFSVESENAVLKSLLNRGGMSSMFSMVSIFIGALGLGGMIAGTHILEPVIDGMARKIRSGKSLMLITMAVVALCMLLVATNHFAFAMVGTLFPPLFKKYNLKPENCSRILEDVGTLGGVLLPWNVGGAFVAGTFGVECFAYAPYAFQNWITPIFTLIYTIIGFKIAKIDSSKGIALEK